MPFPRHAEGFVKIGAATALAAWAISTAWLLLYVLTHYAHHQLELGWDMTNGIRIASGVLGLLCYRPLRRWFGGWIARQKVDATDS